MRKRIFSMSLLFVMMFNMLFSSTVANVYAEEGSQNNSSYGITSVENMQINEYQYKDERYNGWGGCLKGKFKIPANAKEGDYFTLELPEDILVLQAVNPNKVWFKINNKNSKVIANVYLVAKNKIEFVLTGDATSDSDYEGDFTIGEEREVLRVNGESKTGNERVGFVPNHGVFYDKDNTNKTTVVKEVEYKTSYHSYYNSGNNSASKSIQSNITVYYKDENFVNEKGRVNIQVAEETKDSITWEVVYNSLESRYLLNSYLYDYVDKNTELYHGNNKEGLKHDVEVFTAKGAIHGGYLKDTLKKIENPVISEYRNKGQYGYAFYISVKYYDLSGKCVVLKVKTKKKSVDNSNSFFHEAYLRVPATDRRGNPKVSYRHDSVVGKGGVFFEDLKKVKLLKVDKETSKEISGKSALFGLYNEDGELLRDEIMDNKGVIEISNLKVGDKYKIKELIAPDGYKLDKTKEYTLEVLDNGKYKLNDVEYSNENKAKIENEKEEPKKPKNDIVIVKLREDGKSGLSGAMFSITNKDSQKKYTPTVRANKSDFDVKDLEDGNYILRETETPKGYKGIAPIEFNVKNENGEAKVKLVKENKDVEIFYDIVQEKKETQIKIKNHPNTPIPEPPTPTPPKEETPLTPLNVNISVIKNWLGSYDKKASIKVYLKKNGVKTDQFVTLSEENDWMDTFENLPIVEKVGDKKAVEYTVEEENTVNGKVTIGDQTYEVTINDDAIDEFYITNKNITVPPIPEPPTPPVPEQPKDEKRSIKVKKIWKNEKGEVENVNLIPVVVELYKEGEAKNLQEVTLTGENDGYEVEFVDLPVKDEKGFEIKYYVRESAGLVGYKSTVEGDMDKGFVITNTKLGENPPPPTPIPPTPEQPEDEKRNIKVNKVWLKEDGSIDTEVQAKLKITLYADDKKVEEVELSSLTTPKYEYEFKDLPKFDDKRKEIQYRVEEITKFVDFESKITGDMDKGFIITNKRTVVIPPTPEPPTPPTIDIPQIPLTPSKTKVKVEKVWEGISKEEAPEVTVYLLKNGARTGESIELNKQNNWIGEFKNLDVVDNITDKQENKYTVEEKALIGYKTVITGDAKTGFVITNTKTGDIPPIPELPTPPTPPTIDIPQIPLTPSKTKVKVEKVWEGISKEEAPEVTVYLLKNGARTGESIELNKQNNWIGEFKNLDVVDNITDKQENKYTVEEKALIGYKTVITGDAKTGFVITNTKEIDKPNPPVETPEKPNNPNPPVETPEKPSKPGRRLPQTGDGVNITLYAGLMAISGSLLLLMEFRRRKNKNVNEEK